MSLAFFFENMNTISIIGAGIGGLTLGNILKQHHIDFKIYESASEIKPVGAGIMMAINAMQVFEKLGIKEKIENAGNKINSLYITNENLKVISKQNILAFEKKFGVCNVAIHRAELQKILTEQIPPEQLQLNHQLTKIEKQQNWNLHFENGNSIQSDILFGADGIKSVVRNQIFKTGKIRSAHQKCWRGVLTTSLAEKYNHEAFELWGKGKRFGFVKIAENTLYWYAVINENFLDNTKKIVDYYREFHCDILEIIENTPEESIFYSEISDLEPMQNWFQENVCLVGDAAHATTPNLGQGACQAIEDAYIIGKLLEKNQDFNSVFAEFQNIRKSKVNEIVATSRKIGEISHWKKGTFLRNFAMKLIPESMSIKQIEKIITLEL